MLQILITNRESFSDRYIISQSRLVLGNFIYILHMDDNYKEETDFDTDLGFGFHVTDEDDEETDNELTSNKKFDGDDEDIDDLIDFDMDSEDSGEEVY